MNCYEHTFITKGDLLEKQKNKLVDKYEDIINKNFGKVITLYTELQEFISLTGSVRLLG